MLFWMIQKTLPDVVGFEARPALCRQRQLPKCAEKSQKYLLPFPFLAIELPNLTHSPEVQAGAARGSLRQSRQPGGEKAEQGYLCTYWVLYLTYFTESSNNPKRQVLVSS